jgi:hypothetical protein
MRALSIMLLSAPLLSGCASTLGTYLQRPTDYTGLPRSDAQNKYTQVATLSLDATRRLMIAPLNSTVKTCSEPPPDAAASLLAEMGLSGKLTQTGGTAAEAELKDKFQTTLASIAKRTAAVEFWRTTSFVYCQMRLNSGEWNGAAQDYMAAAKEMAKLFDEPEKEPEPKPKPAGE